MPIALPLLLFLFWFSYTFLCFGTDFVFNSVALEHLGDEDALAAFFGKVGVAANFANLIYQMVFAGLFVTHYGISRSLRTLMGLVILVWALAYFFPSLVTIAITQGILYFFVDNVASSRLNTIFGLFPDSIRGRIKVLTEGLGRPAGTVLLFILSVVMGSHMGVEPMRHILFGTALLMFLSGLIFRRVYVGHTLGCLQSDNTTLVSNAVQALGEPNNAAAVEPLRSLLAKTDSLGLKRNIVLSLGRIQSEEALKDIVNLFLVPNEFMKLAVVKALTSYNNYEAIFALLKEIKFNPGIAIDSRLHLNTATFLALVGKKMTPFLLEALLHEDVRVRASAVEGIGLLRDRQTIPVLLPFLSEGHHRIRVKAAVALYPFWSTRK
ncbi:MAG: HEAT repeat domain-containing protein, partial [Candidatus Omnitrophota bacterium]